ncbi:MAG: acyl-CoA dehydrogenase family protein, partial [Desulfobacterales bacterium]|nr:acyl-CoA dehydrogenase family protein [Desulfobacterales bacterium]
DPVVRQEIADLEIGFRTGRLMVMRSLLGKPPKAYSALTKVFCTQHQQRISAFAERALEAAGLSDAALVKAMCYSPAYTIQGGTSEVLNNVIGERLLGLPR